MKRIKTVLLADASTEFRAMLRDAMEATGEFSVMLAQSGPEVLELVRAHTPDLLVMDLALPGMDGLSVLRQLRLEQAAPATFLISAFVSDPVLLEATELRADYFLPKPFDFSALFSKMRGLLALPAQPMHRPPSVRVTSLLHELGMSPGLKGYRYIHDAVLLALDEPMLLHAVTKAIYPGIAKQHGTTSACVERAIRHAIEIAWERGDPSAQHRYFGHLSGGNSKPTNGAFIAVLVEALTMEKLG